MNYSSHKVSELSAELKIRNIPHRSKLTTKDKIIEVLKYHDTNPSPNELSSFILGLSNPKKRAKVDEDEESVNEIVQSMNKIKVSKDYYLIMIDIPDRNATTLVYDNKTILIEEIKEFVQTEFKVIFNDSFDKDFDLVLKAQGMHLPQNSIIHIYPHIPNSKMKIRVKDFPDADKYISYKNFV